MLKFSKLLEQVATAYLRRHGLVVLERTFVGVALGYCHALHDGNDVFVSPNDPAVPLKIIAINSSTVECIQERDNDLCSRNRSQ